MSLSACSFRIRPDRRVRRVRDVGGLLSLVRIDDDLGRRGGSRDSGSARRGRVRHSRRGASPHDGEPSRAAIPAQRSVISRARHRRRGRHRCRAPRARLPRLRRRAHRERRPHRRTPLVHAGRVDAHDAGAGVRARVGAGVGTRVRPGACGSEGDRSGRGAHLLAPRRSIDLGRPRRRGLCARGRAARQRRDEPCLHGARA